MQNSESLNKVFTELEKISDQLSQLISSGNAVSDEGLHLVSAQLHLAGRTLEILQKLGKTEVKQMNAVAEETIPVNLKEVVGMSLENTAPVSVKREEPAPARESIPVFVEEPKPVKPEPTPVKESIAPPPVEPLKPVKSEPAPAKSLEDLKSMIGLNQKFAFIKLFGGDTNAWNDALQRLNALSSYEESAVLIVEYRKKYGWDADDEAAQGLTEMVGRRYL